MERETLDFAEALNTLLGIADILQFPTKYSTRGGDLAYAGFIFLESRI